MTLNANIVLTLASIFLILSGIVVLIITSPSAKHPKHDHLK